MGASSLEAIHVLEESVYFGIVKGFLCNLSIAGKV